MLYKYFGVFTLQNIHCSFILSKINCLLGVFVVNLLSLLPNELIAKISEYADSKTKRELSMVDRRTNAVVLDAVRCIRVFPANHFLYQNHSLDIPEDVLVRVICRYQTLKRITFGPPKNWGGSDEFGYNEVPYLKSLISYLNSNPENHPLSSVKKIEFREITKDNFRGFKNTQAKELNNSFLSAIGHKGLEKIKVKSYHNGSILTGTEIQPVLTNSPNLKTFLFDAFQSNQSVSLSFSNQPKLSKVKLLNWKGPASTIESLRHCEELEELVIDYRAYSSNEIKRIFFGEHSWNLKRLELIGIAPQNDAELDAFTKKLPNLECLGINLHGISHDGMELLGRNCPNLRVLQFSNRDLTDSGLDRLTQYLPHLEIISFDFAYKITEEGIAAIARSCKNLRFLRVVQYYKIEKAGIDALVENCPNLKVVGFSYGGPVSLEGMHHLAEQMPNVRYVELYSIDDVQEEQIQGFYQKFPNIRKIPYISSVKKLHNLTI